MARKKEHGGGHGWFVTFADLMGLLLAYFVMLVAFSSPKKEEMALMAGSMRQAFGMQADTKLAGLLELDGMPNRAHTKNQQHRSPEDSSDIAGPGSNADQAGIPAKGAPGHQNAAAMLRQALEDMPEIAELSRNIIMRETPEGVAMSLVDADGRSMFAQGSPHPYDRTRYLLARISEALRRLPNPIQVVGHTSAAADTTGPGGSPHDLAVARANTVRRMLEDQGLGRERIHSVIGKGDGDPLFPEDPAMAANRRVDILVMPVAGPVPAGWKP